MRCVLCTLMTNCDEDPDPLRHQNNMLRPRHCIFGIDAGQKGQCLLIKTLQQEVAARTRARGIDPKKDHAQPGRRNLGKIGKSVWTSLGHCVGL